MKVSGTRCGSPALRGRSYCYFHMRWHRKGRQVKPCLGKEEERSSLPALDNACSIQLEVAEVKRQLESHMIDGGTASLLLYALQIASSTLKFTSFDPESGR